MPSPKFNFYINESNPVPGQAVYVEIFSTVELISPPTVRVSSTRFATYLTQTGVRSWRYWFKVFLSDTGVLSVSGTSLTNDFGQSILTNVFNIKYSGDPNAPFGYIPFGYGYFGTVFLFGPDTTQEEVDPYNFVVRRGYEGPQIVTEWNNPEALTVKVLKKLYDYPLSDTDNKAFEVYNGTGNNYSDLDVLDQEVYYYALFVESEESPGVFLRMGKGHVLAIDNQPYNDWFRNLNDVLSRTTTNQPVGPSEGDAYLLPTGAVGVDWAGQDGKYAIFVNGLWQFYDPLNLWTINVLDENVLISYKIGQWVEVIDRSYRNDFYSQLTSYDKSVDQLSAFDVMPYDVSLELNNEQFNFDIDGTIGRPTYKRFLKIFNLPFNEWLGEIEYFCEFYNIQKVDLDYLLHAASLIGYIDYPTLANPLKRFLIQQMSYLYDKFGSEWSVNLAIPMWLGEEVGYIIQNHKDNVFTANQSETPIITPFPDPNYDSPLDQIDKTVTFNLPEVFHHRGQTLWLTQPFATSTFIEQEPVLDFISDPPLNPDDGDRYLVISLGTGDFQNQEGSIAQYDQNTLSWLFSFPQDRWSIENLATGDVYVFKSYYNSWWKALPLERLLRLDWWWRTYAQPGSVFYNFREIDGIPIESIENLNGNPIFIPVTEILLFEFEDAQGW